MQSSPAIGANGMVYVGSDDKKVYALNGATGQKRWEFTTGDYVHSSPAIGADGTVYVGSRDGNVYALSSTSVGRLANSPWPKFRGDAQNTGRALRSGPDVTPPTVAAVSGDPTLTRVTVRFSEPVAVVTATNVANYALSGGLQVRGATMGADGSTVVLSTSTQTPRQAYTVTVNRVTDVAGNVIAPDCQASFTSPEAQGRGQFMFGNKNRLTTPPIDARVFDTDCATPLAGTAFWTQAYVKPASDPDTSFVPVGGEVSFRTGANAGYILPVVLTAPFPADTVIAVEMRGWDAAFGDSYEEALAGGGRCGRSAPVTLKLTTAPFPPADMVGLRAWCLQPSVRMPPWFTGQPSDVRVALGAPFALSVSAANAAPWNYQWYQDSQPLPGQNAPLLSVAQARFDDAGAYHVTVANEVGSATSRVAMVVVGFPLTATSSGPGDIHRVPALAVYEPLQQVVLTATPANDGLFLGWSGDVSGTANPTTLSMDGPKQVQAHFVTRHVRLRWTLDTGSPLLSCPALGQDGTLLVPTATAVLALDGATGATKWSAPLACRTDQSLAVGADGTVYVGSWDHHLHALNGSTGDRKWAYDTGSTLESAPAVGGDGTVYVACSNRLGHALITALDGALGTRKWGYLSSSLGRSSFAIGAERTVYVGTGANLIALDGESGTRDWVIAGELAVEPAIGADGTVYAKSGTGYLHARVGSTGEPRWVSPYLGQGLSGPVIGFADTIYLGATSNLYAVKITSGKKVWEFKAGAWIQATPAVTADNTVYAASVAGTLYALDGETGQERWRFNASRGFQAAPAVGKEGMVYVGASDGVLYALEGDSGLAPTPWPKFRRDAQNTGQAPGEPPALERQPFRVILTEGGEGRLSARFSGTPAPRIQWFFNGAAISDGTNATLVLPGVARAMEGFYAVAASNWLGQATSAPIVAVVSNVDPAYFPGWRWEGSGAAVTVEASSSVFGPWTDLFSPTAGATAGHYVETNLVWSSFYYRFREESGQATARFTATGLVPGWWYQAGIGSRHRIEYVWDGSGWTNWVVLTELTLPESPHLFLDTDAFDHPGAVYRTTPLP